MSEHYDDENDRWSYFKEPDDVKIMKNRKYHEPDFDECLIKVLLQKSRRRQQEDMCKKAAHLVKMVTDVAYSLSTEWKEYTNANPKSGVVTAPLRTLAEDRYECMVPLKRPFRLDGFKVCQRGIDEMPQHRCLIQVNPALSKEEAHLIEREWEPFIDKNKFLRPKGLLEWFNKGINKACPVLLTENHAVDKLGCYVGADGTATVHATMTDFDGDELAIHVFSVNIYPVFVLDALPSSLKLTAPLPCFGSYIQGQMEFRKLVLGDIEDGVHIAYLDPKSESTHSPVQRCLPKAGPTWKLNLSLTEYHVYNLIDKYCRGLNFRHVLILMNIIRDAFPVELGVLNNEILVNTLFNVSQKHIDHIRNQKAWILRMLQALVEWLDQGFLPSFYLPRHNLLTDYDIPKEKQRVACTSLKTILTSIKSKSKNLYKFTGYIDPIKGSKVQSTASKPYDDIDDVVSVPIVNQPIRELSARGGKMAASGKIDETAGRASALSQRTALSGKLEEGKEGTDTIRELPKSALTDHRTVVFEEDSTISRLTKNADRSDIY